MWKLILKLCRKYSTNVPTYFNNKQWYTVDEEYFILKELFHFVRDLSPYMALKKMKNLKKAITPQKSNIKKVDIITIRYGTDIKNTMPKFLSSRLNGVISIDWYIDYIPKRT